MGAKSDVFLEFIDFEKLDDEGLLRILLIRNQPSVRHGMYTDHEIGQDEHYAWIAKLKESPNVKFFAVQFEGKIVGCAGLTSINFLHRRADWVFYLSEEVQGLGVGSALETQFITLVFDRFPIEKLNCEVISFNDKVVQMHKRFGFVVEGIRREHVIRGDEKFDSVFLGLTKSEWETWLRNKRATA